jgi:hypothetical protein
VREGKREKWICLQLACGAECTLAAVRQSLNAARLEPLHVRISSEQFRSVLTPFVKNLTLRLMGDKSPKATHKQAAQKQKASAAKKKTNAPSSKPVPKPK